MTKFSKCLFLKKEQHLATSATQQKKKFFLLFLFVNGAGQMSASQNSPKQSKIKSYKFLTFFIA